MARVETVVVPKPEFDALVAEVERLRADLEQARLLKLSELGGDFTTIKVQRDDARAEVERLRRVIEEEHQKWERKIERLRAEKERFRDAAMYWQKLCAEAGIAGDVAQLVWR